MHERLSAPCVALNAVHAVPAVPAVPSAVRGVTTTSACQLQMSAVLKRLLQRRE